MNSAVVGAAEQSSGNSQNSRGCADLLWREISRPLVMTMTIFGMYHESHPTSSLHWYDKAGLLQQLYDDFMEAKEKMQPDTRMLEWFRQRFNILCRSVELTDKMFSPLIAIAYMTNIPNVIFLLYQLWFDQRSIMDYVTISFWIGSGLTNMCLISYFAVMIHERKLKVSPACKDQGAQTEMSTETYPD
ncbi:uncharacterized protein [Diadema setosum]|uniref:uncharacterized protein n=1 Tax=Diadema setosum TaxID=31175 RepID=UPI003B3BB2DA